MEERKAGDLQERVGPTPTRSTVTVLMSVLVLVPKVQHTTVICDDVTHVAHV
jgi:hypothetical protein